MTPTNLAESLAMITREEVRRDIAAAGLRPLKTLVAAIATMPNRTDRKQMVRCYTDAWRKWEAVNLNDAHHGGEGSGVEKR